MLHPLRRTPEEVRPGINPIQEEGQEGQGRRGRVMNSTRPLPWRTTTFTLLLLSLLVGVLRNETRKGGA